MKDLSDISCVTQPSKAILTRLRRAINKVAKKRKSSDLSAVNVPEVEIISLVEERIPKYQLKQDYLTRFGGPENEDWVVQTPALPPGPTELTPAQAEATLQYLVSCGDRLTQMTKTYHDVEAVTRLLEEKEKDLELAAKIGTELLQRNKESDERISKLETELCSSNDLITQLRHELQVKTDLLHVYTNDVEDASPLELRSFNIELLEKKINELEEENKNLHEEASKMAHEAYKCEEKEEKLVKDAVQHLTQANMQIKDLHHQFSYKVDESSRQREEINGLLSQVCDLQNRVQKYSHENDDLTANLRVYQETQDELTSELLDLKEKYREVVDLLRDANEEIRKGRKRTYPGMGKQTGMFSMQTQIKDENPGNSLQAELFTSVKTPRSESKSEISDSDTDLTSAMGSSAYRKAARTFRAIARSSGTVQSSADTSKATGSVFQSYTISRENSFSPDNEDMDYFVRQENKLKDDPDISDDSGTGLSTGLGSLSSSAPREELAREMLRQATRNSFRSSQTEPSPVRAVASSAEVESEVISVQTVGQLRRPSLQLTSSLLQSTPLGQVPGRISPSTAGHPSLGVIPGRSISALSQHDLTACSDYDETEPLERLTTTSLLQGDLGDYEDTESLDSISFSRLRQSQPKLGQENFTGGSASMTNSLAGHPQLGTVPSLSGHPQLGTVPSLSGHPQLGTVPSLSGHPQLGTVPSLSGHPQLGTVPSLSGHPQLGTVPSLSGHPQLGTVPSLSGHPQLGTVPSLSGHPQLGTVPSLSGHPQLGTVPSLSGHPQLGTVPSLSGHPQLGTVPSLSGHPQLGTVPSLSGHPQLGTVPSLSGHPQLGTVPSLSGHPQPGTVPVRDFDQLSTWSSHDDFSLEEEFNISSSEGGEKFKGDSGVISGDYSDYFKNPDVDALSDGGLADLTCYPGIRLGSEVPSDPLSVELETTLKHLNPAEVERRRKLMGRNYSYDLGSEGLGSPGAIAGCEDFFRNLPYGVEVSQTQSTNSFVKAGTSSSLGYRTRRLPDKLRIVKPIEGSLTLHNWSRLATPHLGGVLEERCGVAIKGNEKAGLDPLFDMYRLEDLEEDEEPEMSVPRQIPPTNTNYTFTNSTVLHPDTTMMTNMYASSQMSSGVPSRTQSRMASRCSSMSDLSGPSPYLPNIGLVKLLSQKKISGARRSQLDLSSVGSISSLTPSVLNSPLGSRRMSPTFTPPHTPEENIPGSPEDNQGDEGYVASFFSSLKAAIYGQQRKQHRTSKFQRKMEEKRNKLGIMEALEEDRSDLTEEDKAEKEGTPMSMPPLSTVGKAKSARSSSAGPEQWSDFDVRYLGVLDDFDELEDIRPGVLTLSQSTGAPRDPEEYTKQWIGQLSLPSLSATGRPSLQKTELGKIPASDPSALRSNVLCSFGGRGPGRPGGPGGLGVPGRPGAGAVAQALGGRRPDLGQVPGSLSAGLEVELSRNNYQVKTTTDGIPQSSSFMGSLTDMFFGRKGGYY